MRQSVFHENAWSEKQGEAIKGLSTETIDEYKNLSAEDVFKVKSDISKARTRISNARKNRDYINIKKVKKEIRKMN